MSAPNRDKIRQRVCEIISDSTNFAPSELEAQASENLHKELGIDSLTLLEVALSIDMEFETDFPEEELLGMETIEKATDLVLAGLESKKGISP